MDLCFTIASKETSWPSRSPKVDWLPKTCKQTRTQDVQRLVNAADGWQTIQTANGVNEVCRFDWERCGPQAQVRCVLLQLQVPENGPTSQICGWTWAAIFQSPAFGHNGLTHGIRMVQITLILMTFMHSSAARASMAISCDVVGTDSF